MPYWAELDANDSDADEQALLIHPAVNFGDGHHIVVAMRNLRDGSGNLIQPSAIFRDYRDGLALPTPAEQDRSSHMEAIFTELARPPRGPQEPLPGLGLHRGQHARA